MARSLSTTVPTVPDVRARVTVDVFSGRTNPSWELTPEQTRELLAFAALNPDAIDSSPSGTEGFQGLGFRGLQVDFISDADTNTTGLPSSMRIATGHDLKSLADATDFVSSLVKSMPTVADVSSTDVDYITTAIDEFPHFMLESTFRNPLEEVHGPATVSDFSVPVGALGSVSDTASLVAGCPIHLGPFNPGFWNDNINVRRSNNCYNYACNRRTDTFAQPGRAAGRQARRMACDVVIEGARADGLVNDKCVPEKEAPIWLAALVVAPGIDYHWYRLHSDVHNGCHVWGHKPGQTQATDRDNSGKIITDIRKADRGIYTDVCSAFLVGKSVVIR